MNVILRKDVPNLGSFGENVKVAPGYARNFLIPRGMAVLATAGNLSQVNAEKQAYSLKAKGRLEKAEKLAGELNAVVLEFSRKVAEENRLFGSVTEHDVETALKAKGFEVGKKEILLAEHIKTLGEHKVSVKLHPQVVASITVVVNKED